MKRNFTSIFILFIYLNELLLKIKYSWIYIKKKTRYKNYIIDFANIILKQKMYINSAYNLPILIEKSLC